MATCCAKVGIQCQNLDTIISMFYKRQFRDVAWIRLEVGPIRS